MSWAGNSGGRRGGGGLRRAAAPSGAQLAEEAAQELAHRLRGGVGNGHPDRRG
jgi:hypothetical protein